MRHAEGRVHGRARVGYVHLQQCGCWGHWYSEYGRAQAYKFTALAPLGYDLVAMPTLEVFSGMYLHEQNEGRFFRSKGVHLSPAR